MPSEELKKPLLKSLDEYIATQETTTQWDVVHSTEKARLRKERENRYRVDYHNRARETIHGRAVYMHSCIKSRAKKAGLEYDLDVAWFEDKLQKPCERTGLPFRLLSGKGRYWDSPSVDKIDRLKGYTKDNCQMVVDMYNMCKNQFHDDNVVAFAKALVAYTRDGEH